ncbi:MAG: DUF4194 domain-containing protein [Methylococcaceae bacterium]|jgi:hypothetical protein|nr:DUF4194 domain-containing protein [Methylococcaceae bacterium]
MTEEDTLKISPVVIHLLKGIVFRNDQPQLWQDLLDLQAHVIDYLKVLDLELTIDDSEGYAWLTQRAANVEEKNPLPRLIARRPLSYPVSLLCVLLRKKIAESDASGAEVRVIVSREELMNAMRVFMPEKSNEAKIEEQMNATITKVVDLGFLRKLKADTEQLEIQRFLTALVDAEWTASLNDKLKEYQEYAQRTA